MAQPRVWRRMHGGLLHALSMLGMGSFIISRAFDGHVTGGELQVSRSLAAGMAACLPFCVYTLWRELRSWGEPGATIDYRQITAWSPLGRQPQVIPFDEVERVDWEALGVIALRLRSGEVRSISPDLGKRAREEFFAAVRSQLAERRAA